MKNFVFFSFSPRNSESHGMYEILISNHRCFIPELMTFKVSNVGGDGCWNESRLLSSTSMYTEEKKMYIRTRKDKNRL